MSNLSLFAKAQDRMENIFLLLGYKGSGIKPSLHFPFFLPDYRGISSLNTLRVAAKREEKTQIYEKLKLRWTSKNDFEGVIPGSYGKHSTELRENDVVPKPKQIQSLSLAQSEGVFPHREPYMLLR